MNFHSASDPDGIINRNNSVHSNCEENIVVNHYASSADTNTAVVDKEQSNEFNVTYAQLSALTLDI